MSRVKLQWLKRVQLILEGVFSCTHTQGYSTQSSQSGHRFLLNADLHMCRFRSSRNVTFSHGRFYTCRLFWLPVVVNSCLNLAQAIRQITQPLQFDFPRCDFGKTKAFKAQWFGKCGCFMTVLGSWSSATLAFLSSRRWSWNVQWVMWRIWCYILLGLVIGRTEQ